MLLYQMAFRARSLGLWFWAPFFLLLLVGTFYAGVRQGREKARMEQYRSTKVDANGKLYWEKVGAGLSLKTTKYFLNSKYQILEVNYGYKGDLGPYENLWLDEQGRYLRAVRDVNRDGKIDEWIEFDERELPKRLSRDLLGDGNRSMEAVFDRDGKLAKIQYLESGKVFAETSVDRGMVPKETKIDSKRRGVFDILVKYDRYGLPAGFAKPSAPK